MAFEFKRLPICGWGQATRAARTRLELTADGSDLFSVVCEAVGRIADTVQAIRQRQNAAKPVVMLSMSSSFVAHWLLPRLGEFHAAFPQIDIHFDLIPGVLRGIPDNVDLATRIIEDGGPRYHRWFFAPEIIFPVCSLGYLKARGRLDQAGDGSGHRQQRALASGSRPSG